MKKVGEKVAALQPFRQLFYFFGGEGRLVDDVEADVLAEHFGDYDAFGGLIVFEQGGHDAGEGESRAVEGVGQTGLLVVATVAALKTVGLFGVVF